MACHGLGELGGGDGELHRAGAFLQGMLGGLGGFFCPIIFGYLLEGTGLWTSCWMFMFLLSLVCLVWLHWTTSRFMQKKHPQDMRRMELNAEEEGS